MSRALTNPSWRPYIVLAIGLLAVSSASIMIRLAQAENVPSLVISAWRVGLATLVLTPIVFTRYRADLARFDRKQIGLMLLGGLLLAIHFASWITSLEYTSVIASVVLVTANPLWVALMAPIFLRERLSKVTVGAILVAFVGATLIATAGGAGTAPHQESPMLGNGLAVLGAITVAGYFIIGRRLRATIPTIPYIWMTYGAAAIVLLAIVLIMGLPLAGLSSRAYLWMTLLALLPQLIGHSSYAYALGYLSAAYVSLTVLGESIGSTILAAILLHEQPAAPQLFGSALILLAVFVASREETKSSRRAREEAVEQVIAVS
jgi:drug/metabolite transporter (DMT)-like permease